ncbi:MAG TPA: hypothetical protein VIV11_42990 [Kofleriaceae bacterium]
MIKRALLLLVVVGCGGDGYDPTIDPAHFVTGVDSPWFPLVPGTVFEYDVLETDETVTVTVTSETKVVMGVSCVVVRDIARSGGQIVEDTFDWYAQDDQGNVWYMGEDTTAFDGGMTSKEGSWEGGVDGAKPGIIMRGTPKVGDRYYQEFYKGEAEDEGEVLSIDASVMVPYGSFTGCVQTRDFTALDPEVEENKYYCPGVGQVRAMITKGGAEHEDLISVTNP